MWHHGVMTLLLCFIMASSLLDSVVPFCLIVVFVLFCKGGAVKKVHFIRHGQGFHNVAQAEWRAAGKSGEPYTLATDPTFGFGDAMLTPVRRRRVTHKKRRAVGMNAHS